MVKRLKSIPPLEQIVTEFSVAANLLPLPFYLSGLV